MHIISAVISLMLLGFVLSVIATMLVSFRREILTALIATPRPSLHDVRLAYVHDADISKARVSAAVGVIQPELLALAA